MKGFSPSSLQPSPGCDLKGVPVQPSCQKKDIVDWEGHTPKKVTIELNDFGLSYRGIV